MTDDYGSIIEAHLQYGLLGHARADLPIPIVPEDILRSILRRRGSLNLPTSRLSLAPYRTYVTVKAKVGSRMFVGVWRGGLLKCIAFPDNSSLNVGDSVIVTRIKDTTEYFYYALGGDVYLWIGTKQGGATTQFVRYLKVVGATVVAGPQHGFEVLVTAIAPCRKTPLTCYVATQEAAAGGTIRIWRTVDGGTNWTNTWSQAGTGNLVVRPKALWVNPDDSSKVTFGTEGDITNVNFGIYRSVDSGVTCTKTAATIKAGFVFWRNPAGFYGIFETPGGKIWAFHDPIINPPVPDGRPGYHWSSSTDGGATWNVFAWMNTGGWESTAAGLSHAVMADDGSMLVGIKYIAGSHHHTFYSIDSGVTWAQYDDGIYTQYEGHYWDLCQADTTYWARQNRLTLKGYYTDHFAVPFPWTSTVANALSSQSSVHFDPEDKNTIYYLGAGLAGQSHASRTTDLGATVVDLTGVGIDMTLTANNVFISAIAKG